MRTSAQILQGHFRVHKRGETGLRQQVHNGAAVSPRYQTIPGFGGSDEARCRNAPDHVAGTGRPIHQQTSQQALLGQEAWGIVGKLKNQTHEVLNEQQKGPQRALLMPGETISTYKTRPHSNANCSAWTQCCWLATPCSRQPLWPAWCCSTNDQSCH